MKLERELPKNEILEPLPQHHLLRAGRLRRAGRVEDLLRQGRRRPHAARGRLPRRADPRPGDWPTPSAPRPIRRSSPTARLPSGGAPRCSTPCCARSYITQEQHDADGARSTSPTCCRASQVKNFGTIAHTDMRHRVLRRLRRPVAHVGRGDFTEAEVYGGGLRVYTTLDYGMQADGGRRGPRRRSTARPTRSRRWWRSTTQGHVKAMYGRPRLRRPCQVNLATGRRRRSRPSGRVDVQGLRAGRGPEAGHRAGEVVQRAGPDHDPQGRRGQGLEAAQRRRRRPTARSTWSRPRPARSTPSSPSW